MASNIYCMINKILFSLIPFFLHARPSPAQDHKIEVEVYKIQYPSPGESMEYRFPKKVTNMLNERMRKIYKRDICFEASFRGDTVTLFMYKMSEPTSALRNHWDTLLRSSNRHWSYIGWKLPLYFASDTRFSFVNWTMNDGDYIKFVCKDWTDDQGCIVIEKTWR